MKRNMLLVLTLCITVMLFYPVRAIADDSKTDISGISISIPRDEYYYTGFPIRPNPKVVPNLAWGKRELIEGSDYELTYLNNVEVGTATIKVIGIGAYEGECSLDFQIVAGENIKLISAKVSPEIASSWITLRHEIVLESEREIERVDLNYEGADNAGFMLTPTGGNSYKSDALFVDYGNKNIVFSYGDYHFVHMSVFYSDGGSIDIVDSDYGARSFSGYMSRDYYGYVMDFPQLDFTLVRRNDDVSPMYRLYNPNSGEHFYTSNSKEKDKVIAAGWNDEGIGWVAPLTSDVPVYRLYSGTDHHYTLDENERNYLKSIGWKDEGIGWYSDDREGGIPLLRQFNPYVDPSAKRNNSGSHNYTTSQEENDSLVSKGWIGEGVAWFGSPIR